MVRGVTAQLLYCLYIAGMDFNFQMMRTLTKKRVKGNTMMNVTFIVAAVIIINHDTHHKAQVS